VHLALVHPYRWPMVRRGGERYLDDLTRYLRSAGHDVDVVTLGEPADGVHAVRDRAAPFTNHLGWSEIDRFGLAAAPALLRRYDLVHALVPSAAVAARTLGHRVVYTLLGEPTAEMLSRNRGRGRLLRAAVRHSRLVTALSPASARACAELLAVDATVLPPGVDLERFPLATAGRPSEPTVLYSADLSVRRKGLDHLLDAALLMIEEGRNVRVLLSGPGDPRWALTPARRAALAGAVEVLGAGTPEDVIDRYARAHVTALPAREEAFGLSLVESLARGTPVVCGTGGSESMVTRECGRAVESGSIIGLAQALTECLALHERPGTPEACRSAARRFGWAEVVGPAHEAAYARALEA
jgi:glycosyltransferase involved in cell wall biosynthesis